MNLSRTPVPLVTVALVMSLLYCVKPPVDPNLPPAPTTPNSQIVTGLNLLALAAATTPATLRLLQSQGLISSEDVGLGTAYANAVGGKIPAMITEVESTHPNPQKILALVEILSPLIDLGRENESKASAAARVIISGITAGAATLLAILGGPAQPQTESVRRPASARASVDLTIGVGDRRKLAEIRTLVVR